MKLVLGLFELEVRFWFCVLEECLGYRLRFCGLGFGIRGKVYSFLDFFYIKCFSFRLIERSGFDVGES